LLFGNSRTHSSAHRKASRFDKYYRFHRNFHPVA
jgi:hypothetical protein